MTDRLIRSAIPAVLLSLVQAVPASPCGFHNYSPQATLVDRLLGSDEIVLARAAPDNPFRFQPFEALEGDLGASEIPQLVDRTTRLRLALEPDASVLFSRDPIYGLWSRLAFVDAGMAPVVAEVMERLPAWQAGDDLDRFSYFATLVGHPDTRIHELALRELDQADYGLLRELEFDVDPGRLLARLNDLNGVQLKPIRLLLLGLSGSKALQGLFEAGVESSARTGGGYMGANATALIELAGPEAVMKLARAYLTDRAVPLQTRELLIEAISMHAQTGGTEMKEAVSLAIESSLWVDPALAGAVARQFGSRNDWSHESLLQGMVAMDEIAGAEEKQEVLRYLTLASENPARP